MKKKTKILAAAVTIFSLMITVQQLQPQTQPEPTDIRPVSSPLQVDRDNTPSAANKALVCEETPQSSTQTPSQDNTLIEINFEPPTTADSKEILAESSPPRDNTTSTSAPTNNTTATKVCEPKMGDTRKANDQKQVYFLGFGWIDDNNKPNECIYVKDMYEKGNKIGLMGGGPFVDGDGDINKMVGIMD